MVFWGSPRFKCSFVRFSPIDLTAPEGDCSSLCLYPGWIIISVGWKIKFPLWILKLILIHSESLQEVWQKQRKWKKLNKNITVDLRYSWGLGSRAFWKNFLYGILLVSPCDWKCKFKFHWSHQVSRRPQALTRRVLRSLGSIAMNMAVVFVAEGSACAFLWLVITEVVRFYL